MDVREQISGQLGTLAHQRASGALEISGEPGATVFLSGGYLTYAESPGVPDLRSRLISSRRLSAARWSQVTESARARGSIGGHLVSSGIVSDSELRDLLWSVTLDALIALALPLSAAGPSADVRFWPQTSHLIGSYLRLDLASVWATARQKAELLAKSHALADAHPLLTDLQRPWAVLSSEQWTLAWQISGRASIKDLAWQNGFALCDTMEWVEDLIRAGLCVTGASADRLGAVSPVLVDAVMNAPRTREAGPAGYGKQRSPLHEEGPGVPENVPGERGPRHSAGGTDMPAPASDATLGAGPLPASADGALSALPHRNPGASLAARSAKARPPVVPQWRAADIKKPPETSHSDLLHRILRGLRRTDRTERS